MSQMGLEEALQSYLDCSKENIDQSGLVKLDNEFELSQIEVKYEPSKENKITHMLEKITSTQMDLRQPALEALMH